MNTKLVYTVVSSDAKAVYLAQAMVAAYSARRYNSDAEILLVVDASTEKVITLRLPKIQRYVSRIIVADVPVELNNIQRSRWLKTRLRTLIDGDFLFIDTDTVVCGSLAEADTIKGDVLCALDRHIRVSNHRMGANILHSVAAMGMRPENTNDKYFNSGVMLVRDTESAHRFYDEWYRLWYYQLNTTGKHYDQPPMARADFDLGHIIRELPGTWNCQLGDNFLNLLPDSLILHYFATGGSSPYLLHDNSIMKRVLTEGDVPTDIKQALEHPKRMFVPQHIALGGYDILSTNMYSLYRWHPKVFAVLEYIAKVMQTKRFF